MTSVTQRVMSEAEKVASVGPKVTYIPLQVMTLAQGRELSKLLSKSNFRLFGPLNGSKLALKVIFCCPSLGCKC